MLENLGVSLMVLYLITWVCAFSSETNLKVKQAIPEIASLGGDPKEWSKFDGRCVCYQHEALVERGLQLCLLQARSCARRPTTTWRSSRES